MSLGDVHLLSPTDVPGILYQGYFALHCLRKKFTHYDLHINNFGFYKPFSDKYIVMHYVDGPNEVTFPTEYISKIIDYGRCFYDIDGFETPKNRYGMIMPRASSPNQPPRVTSDASTNIIDVICKMPACKPDTYMGCGYESGLGTIAGNRLVHANIHPSPTNLFIESDVFYWINPTCKNESHDLCALHGTRDFLRRHFKDHIGTVVYECNYGTYENIDIPYNSQTKDVRNVSDACIMLSGMIDSIDYNKYKRDKHANNILKAGDLYIYSDGRPYEWNVA